MGTGNYADFLFARPSFIGGMASALDIRGTLITYNDSGTPENADINALRQDWRAVGDSLKQAFAKIESEQDGKR